MKVAVKLALAIATAALVSGPAHAEWFAHGGYEPDTPYDTEDWMWQDAPEGATNRLYFSVISGVNAAVISFGKPTINPNVGALHTRMESPTLEIQHGFLGVWVDCNNDGYIGLAESALREYPSQLADLDICPAATGGPAWQAGAHNYNGWVSEYVPIVNKWAIGINDTRIYYDQSARVWGDFDRPDEDAFQRNCPTTTLPRGTMQTVGGFANYLDCRMDLLGPWNVAMDALGDPADLRFPDEDNASTGRVGQIWVLGPPSTEHAAVTTVDCEEEPTAQVGTVEVREPTPELGPAASDPTSISIGGQVNRTHEEWVDDCEPTNDPGREFTEFGIVGPEGEFNSVNPNNKTESNWNFAVAYAARGAAPFSVGPGAGSGGMPQDGGTGIGGTHWLADSVWAKTGPRTVRYDLESGTVDIARAYWLSFYAFVGPTTTGKGFVLPSGALGTYGEWACGDEVTGIHHGWNCDVSQWYRSQDGSIPFDIAERAKPGWRYQMRDVDCYDGTIGAAGVGASPAFYGDEPCP